nr:thrombospondin type-1 domain-containing protein 4-like [Misgurnus anguillicaudatus]
MRSEDLSIRVVIVMVFLWPVLECHHEENQRKIRSAADPQSSGSWGSWGPWRDCSRSCGGGLQEQTRVCLPHHSLQSSVNPAQQTGNGHTWIPPNRPAAESSGLNPPRPRDQRPLGGLRKSNISPGTYAYGRTSLQKDFTSKHRQRRSASNISRHRARTHHRNVNTRQHPARVHIQQPGVTQTTATSLLTRHNAPLPNTSCPGSPIQHKICNIMACPSSSRPIRELQCSAFNTRPFMGRLYEWEPFHDGDNESDCQLNCRAVGFRFYVRQSDDIIDGTPCEQNNSSVCVAGKCETVGCDDLVSSVKVRDRCGVCAGDGRTCKLISGLFQHSLSKVGYHKIVEIPLGATKINITEMVKSRNYLALRSRSGRSIINGNWAIDRPGMYEGVGTMFTYRRPNEITSTAGESFLAEGPTNEILDVYMIYQQPNPGVHYEFLMPSENPGDPQRDVNVINRESGSDPIGRKGPEERERSGVNRNPNNQLPAAPHPQTPKEYNWKLTGTTDCSASCGRGSRYGVFSCVHRITHAQVSSGLCDSSTKPSQQEEPCNVQPCPAFWDIGEWSECSKTCGLGTQHRQVLCRQMYANRTLTVHGSRCHHLERPEISSTCQLKICSEWQIRSEWSPCSVPCGVGQRSRQVHCVSNVGDIVEDEECNMQLRPGDVENCDVGPCTKSWFFSDWGSQCSAECGVGMRTRNVLCLTNHISSLPLEGCGSERPPEVQACNNGPCESRTEWFAGPWSQCSAECGPGGQQRAVVCLMRSDEGFTVMPPYECSSLDKPLSQQSCFIKTCGAMWYHTDWSPCSKSCDGGYRVREVRCISDHMITTDSCEETSKPHVKEICNPEPCLPVIDEKCRDKYFNCNVVVQARLCVYDYYKMACCASCRRVEQKMSGQRRHR